MKLFAVFILEMIDNFLTLLGLPLGVQFGFQLGPNWQLEDDKMDEFKKFCLSCCFNVLSKQYDQVQENLKYDKTDSNLATKIFTSLVLASACSHHLNRSKATDPYHCPLSKHHTKGNR